MSGKAHEVRTVCAASLPDYARAATIFKSLLVASFAEHAVQVMRMEALVFKVVRTDDDLN